MIPNDLYKQIDELRSTLDKYKPLKKSDDDRLWKKFRLDWNYNSNHMEGNTLTYGHTELLLILGKITGDYKIIAGADETYYIAVRNNNYGVFNNKFDVIVPFEYTMIEKINIGAMVYLKAEKAGLKGILFGTGSPYLAVENSKLQYVQAKDGSNYFIFTKEGKTGLKNTKYQNVTETIYDDITYNKDIRPIIMHDIITPSFK